MQIGKLALEFDVIMRVAADVTSAAGTRADIMQRRLHRADHQRVLAHGEIVIAAPDSDVLGAVVPGKTPRIGIGAPVAQNVDEYAVTAFRMEAVNCCIENLIVVHKATADAVSSPNIPRLHGWPAACFP